MERSVPCQRPRGHGVARQHLPARGVDPGHSPHRRRPARTAHGSTLGLAAGRQAPCQTRGRGPWEHRAVFRRQSPRPPPVSPPRAHGQFSEAHHALESLLGPDSQPGCGAHEELGPDSQPGCDAREELGLQLPRLPGPGAATPPAFADSCPLRLPLHWSPRAVSLHLLIITFLLGSGSGKGVWQKEIPLRQLLPRRLELCTQGLALGKRPSWGELQVGPVIRDSSCPRRTVCPVIRDSPRPRRTVCRRRNTASH